jgi:glutaredoxin
MKNITLYSTGCPKCTVLKNKMDEKGIPYTENSSVDDMASLGVKQVPVLAVDDRLMGFPEANQWINEQSTAER